MALPSRFLALFLFIFVGCTQISGYDLTVMPSYNIRETNQHYNKISEAKALYSMLNLANLQMRNMGITITEEQETEIIFAADKYLYWLSVAHIQLFHQQYDLSDRSCEMSINALEEYKSLLKKILDSKTV